MRHRNRKPNPRKALYLAAALLGDAQAAKRGHVARRIGRRLAGRQSGKQILRRLFR